MAVEGTMLTITVDLGQSQGMSSSGKNEIIATTYVGERRRLYWKDKKFEKAYKKLKKSLKKEIGDGDLYFGSSTKDDRYHFVVVTSDINPGVTYLYDMETGKTEFQYKPRPKLPSEHLAPIAGNWRQPAVTGGNQRHALGRFGAHPGRPPMRSVAHSGGG